MSRHTLFKALSEYVTPHKAVRFDEILARRTRFVTVVLEDFYQSHNVSACLRSCDCFGVQNVHLLEGRYQTKLSKDVALGSAQWLSLQRHDVSGGLNQHGDRMWSGERAAHFYRSLAESGYRLLVADPQPGSLVLEELSLDRPVVILFGTESEGASAEAFAAADERIHIPMVGMTESMNVSVACAVTLHHLLWRLRSGSEVPPEGWQLSEHERESLRFEWSLRIVKKHWPRLAEKLCEEHDVDINDV